eukprot:Pompholyxophrys_sp_v1_NODE_245_length_990_cov_1.197861.p2 type:complete len:107 gc:universal NODE_245_length_990_cov_1.197861:579-899(+)
MPSSIHIALIHGCLFVNSKFLCNAPVGWLTEEGSEGANKEYRRIRLFHSQKNSRSNSIFDVFTYRCAVTDPKIAITMGKSKQNTKSDWDVMEVAEISIAFDTSASE